MICLAHKSLKAFALSLKAFALSFLSKLFYITTYALAVRS
jgi:hypothetical protein